jgi:hypothetical protein
MASATSPDKALRPAVYLGLLPMTEYGLHSFRHTTEQQFAVSDDGFTHLPVKRGQGNA